MFEIAYASTSGAASSGSGMTSILMIVVMLAIFYFLLIRPENKRKKQAEEMRSSLKRAIGLPPLVVCTAALSLLPTVPLSSRPARIACVWSF